MIGRARRGSRLGVGESRAAIIGIGIAAWVVGMLWIFPVGWTLLTSFKTEQDASAQTLHNGLTFGRYSDVSHSTTGTLSLSAAFTNSLVVVVVSTVIVMLLALPAAYALAIRPVPKWRDVLFFFISIDLPDLRLRPEVEPHRHTNDSDHPLHRHKPAAGDLDVALFLH